MRPRPLLRAVVLGGLSLVALAGFTGRARAADSAVKATVRKGVLTITGTSGPDAITLRLQAGSPNTLEIDVGADGTADFRFDRQRFTAIVVNGSTGDDTLVLDPSNGSFTDTELTTLDGGAGNDVLTGANASEKLLGGAGDDFLDGNMGADTMGGGDGNDVIAWDPGDASDTVTGGTGSDRLVFNGSAANETFDLSAIAAGHVRLARNIGTVTMDLDDIETLDLHTRSGTDTVTINNLTGTDLTTITTDLAANDGSDDTVADEVVVPPGVVIGQDGTVAVVDGLGAQVRVVNGGITDAIHLTGTANVDVVSIAGTPGDDTISAIADGTDVVVQGATATLPVRLSGIDQLAVNLAAGNDTFTTTGNLAALTTLNVDGGDGNDTLLGSNGNDTFTGGAGDDFLDGNMGADTMGGGDGNDVIAWDPGDASDTVTGGTGSDRLVFNGSAANETFDLSAIAAGHVRLARNIGTVTMDLDDIETLDLHTRSGTDTVTINNLTGTDLTTITTDLAANGTTTDGAADEVIVNGTPGGDAIAVVDDGSDVVVQGLAATVRIANADPTLDRLTVNGLEGDDTITATPAAASLMLLNLQP